MKTVNKMNVIELRAQIVLLYGEVEGKKKLADIDAQKLTVAKNRQLLINTIAAKTPEEAEAAPKPTKAELKKEANVLTLTTAGFVFANGNYSKEGSTIVIADAELDKLTPKQLEKAMTPTVAKVEFTGYTDEEKAAFEANIGRMVTFQPSSKVSLVEVNGVIKAVQIEARSGKCFYGIDINGIEKRAWTRNTNSTLKIGEMAPVEEKVIAPTKAEIAAAKMEVVAPEVVK